MQLDKDFGVIPDRFESYILRINAKRMDAIERFYMKKCAYCGQSLDEKEHPHIPEVNGIVCDLCLVLWSAVRMQPGLVQAEEEWKRSRT